MADLAGVEEIAKRSAVGVTSLPPDREQLAEKIRGSEHSFASDVSVNGEETYFFVMEDLAKGKIVGTSGIVASAGFHDRFYSYRSEIIVHASQELKVSNRIRSLHLCHDLTGYSLLASFFIDPAYTKSQWPQLLSRARLLFIAEHGHRFAEKIAAEHPGLCDDRGQSPFWDAVGRRFFDMEYPQAERLSGGRSKTFIAELMPQYPIYVPLLPAPAQLAIGQLHPVAELPFSILLDEGFEADTYVDIFDGGPTVEARIQTLKTVRENRRLRVNRSPLVNAHFNGGYKTDRLTVAAPQLPYMIATTNADGFRATIASASVDGGEITVCTELANALEVGHGDSVRAVLLGGGWGSAL